MNKVNDLTREEWILGAFPEWGTWLNEEIDEEVVAPGTFAMWWIGCTGLWIKSENNTNIAIDLWFGNGKRSKKVKEMGKFHQMRNMTGGRMTQPNLRAAPIVYDPFAVTTVDAVLSTHYHNDHIDPFFAAGVIQNCDPDVPFIGPLKSVEKWLSYGVPKERCRVVKPGDVVKVKDTARMENVNVVRITARMESASVVKAKDTVRMVDVKKAKGTANRINPTSILLV